MMKKISFLSVLLLLAVTMSVASPVDSTIAKNLASKFWELNFGGTRGSADFQNIAPQMGLSNLYVMQNANGEGFVILSADDVASPILAYAEHGSIDVSRMPENFISWLRGYEQEIAFVKSMQIPQSEEVATEWATLAAGHILAPKSPMAVSPLLSTTWDQGSPYNALCPGVGYNKAPTGCVATAMAQVMKYHAYPPKGQGSHSYTCSSYSGTQSANFGNTSYSWSSMPSVCYSSNTAVATLMYHCGVSVNMDYTSNGSGAQTVAYSSVDYSAENSLSRFFGYKNSIYHKNKSSYTDSEWIALLKAELDAGRPLIYTGYDENYTEGHCFVCDGYDNQNKLHFNWGWGGSYDGYFYVTSLTPGGGGWGSSSSNDYTTGQCALFGVEPPALVVNSVFNISPGSANSIKHGTTVSFNVTYKNRTSSAFSGSLKLALVAENGVTEQNIQEVSSVSVSAGSTATATFSSLITAYPGSYKLILYYKPTGSSTWVNVGIGSGANYVDVTVVLPQDNYESNDAVSSPYVFTPNFTNNQATITTTGSNFHVGDAYDYYKIDLPSGYRYSISTELLEAVMHPQQYTCGTRIRVSMNGGSWTALSGNTSGTFVMEDGGPVLFKVWPNTSGTVGTYLLNAQITRSINNSIDEVEESQAFSVFPNPATDKVNVEFLSAVYENDLRVCVYDIYGKLMHSQMMESEKTSLDFSKMAAGVYVIRVVNGNHVIGTSKIVKQ